MNTPSSLVVLVTVVAMAGCAPDITETDFYSMHPDDSEAPQAIEIARFTEQGVEVVLTTASSLADGPNSVSVTFTAGGSDVDGHARLTPSFVSAAGAIASPFPPGDTDGGAAAVVLLAPRSTAGAWTIDVAWDAAGRQGKHTVAVDVVPSNRVRFDPSLDVYATWLAPADPRVGEDDVTFALHRFDGSRWVPVSNASLDLYPYMDMGGGEGHSAPYDAPIHTSGATYTGRINFIMSGGWDLTLMVTLAGQAPASLHFDDFTVR